MTKNGSKMVKKCEKKSRFFEKKSRFSILREIAPVKWHIRKGPEIRWSKNDPKISQICQNGQKWQHVHIQKMDVFLGIFKKCHFRQAQGRIAPGDEG